MVPMSGQSPIVLFDKITYRGVYKPAILITFDDGNESVYDSALPLLQDKNMVATAYINSSTIDETEKLTSAQLQELNGLGWDVANHTANHVDLTLEDNASIHSELTICKTFLDNLGLTRAGSHVAYPGGTFNEAVIASLASWGAKTGRNVVGGGQINACEPDMAYQIYSTSVLNTMLTIPANVYNYSGVYCTIKKGINL